MRAGAALVAIATLAALGVVIAWAAQAAAGTDGDGRAGTDAPAAEPGVGSGVGSVVGAVVGAVGGPSWQALPEVAGRARAAVAGVTGEPLDAVAHGDPGMGCFVLVLRVGRGDASLHRALHEALAQQTPPWSIRDWTVTGDGAGGSARSGFAFTADTLQGEVRAMTRGGQRNGARPDSPGSADSADSAAAPPAGDSMLVACFHDAREPARSARLCQRMLPAIEDALLTLPEIFP